jgi:hypothetical protein
MATNYTAATDYRASTVEYDGDTIGLSVTVNVAGVSVVAPPANGPGVTVKVGGVSVIAPPAGVAPTQNVLVGGVAAYITDKAVTVRVGGIAAMTFSGAGLWRKTEDGWDALHGYHKLSNGDWLRLI